MERKNGAEKIQSWLQNFQSLTMKTSCIELSADFLQYLHSDGLILPKNSIVQTLGRDELSDDEDLKPESNPHTIEPPQFLDLNLAIEKAIQEYGGKVFVKFQRKAPIDSSWINGGTLACHTSGDVYMLLKSSSKVIDLSLSRFVPIGWLHDIAYRSPNVSKKSSPKENLHYYWFENGPISFLQWSSDASLKKTLLLVRSSSPRSCVLILYRDLSKELLGLFWFSYRRGWDFKASAINHHLLWVSGPRSSSWWFMWQPPSLDSGMLMFLL